MPGGILGTFRSYWSPALRTTSVGVFQSQEFIFQDQSSGIFTNVKNSKFSEFLTILKSFKNSISLQFYVKPYNTLAVAGSS